MAYLVLNYFSTRIMFSHIFIPRKNVLNLLSHFLFSNFIFIFIFNVPNDMPITYVDAENRALNFVEINCVFIFSVA